MLLVILLLVTGPLAATASAQNTGAIRGVVYDQDFDAPLALADVTLVETGQSVKATEQGNYVLNEVAPGTYTLVFAKPGYARQVRADVVVTAGQLTEVDAYLTGEFTEMEEFVVQDLQIGGGTEAGLLRLRFDAPALIDSISAELMSQAGASDAASALRLVSGATVQDGKFAVIRGLPDRFVNSQLNGVRLPSADENTRAVELDLFPSAVIESVQVSKTFTPDQQGDASGGAVNVILKSIPEESFIQFKYQLGFNSQVRGESDFLSYDGGGVETWGRDDGRRDRQLDNLGMNWAGAAGVSTTDAPSYDHKWSISGGGKYEFDSGVKIGGFGSFFYERDSSFYDNGIDDEYWVTEPGMGLVPRATQGTPADGDFKTQLFDVVQGSQSVQWGGLAALGIEGEGHKVGMTYLYSRTAEDTATLAEDTRGKEYFFPGYDPDDPMHVGNSPDNRSAAPYLRLETLNYEERTISTLQFRGEHTIALPEFGIDQFLTFQEPIFDWTVSNSVATLYQPDKRQFGSLWWAESFNPGLPPFFPPFVAPAQHNPFKPAAVFTLGNFQRIYKEIEEDSDQYALNLKLPFEQWSNDSGYLKFGIFRDEVDRTFDQDTFSNFNDVGPSLSAAFEQYWSEVFPDQLHPITDGAPFVDVDYHGTQRIRASYIMADIPLTTGLNLIGGVRWEDTKISIVNFPEEDATWFPPGAFAPVELNPGDADVNFEQKDVLPSIGLVFKPVDQITVRASYSETVARQVFKELTPIQQQEFLGGDIFIGNPNLGMAALQNYDLRFDYTPYEGSLVSLSLFQKNIDDPIEYVQRVVGFTYTTPVNFPKGKLKGVEIEVRQHLGNFWEELDGLTIGGNATFIDSEVRLPESERAMFDLVQAPMSSRHMTNAPEFLYNLYITYDIREFGTQLGLFYTVTGDTLVTGAGVSDGNFVPDVYALEYGSLNFTVSQKIGKYLKLQFQAKNLTNPKIEEVYRSDYTGADVIKTSYTRGVDYSLGLTAEIPF